MTFYWQYVTLTIDDTRLTLTDDTLEAIAIDQGPITAGSIYTSTRYPTFAVTATRTKVTNATATRAAVVNVTA